MKISIITASYNYERYIKETIESVIAQTHANWEMIIVDDGSKDNSVDVIKTYCKKDSRIKLYQHENGINKGLKDTVLLGIEKASSEWIVFLESDDTIVPEYLEKKIEIANKYPEVVLIFNSIELMGSPKAIDYMEPFLGKLQMNLSRMSFPKNMLKDLYNENHIPTFSVVMVKKEELYNKDFNSPFKPNLDWYLWLQMAQQHDFYYIQEPLTNWRMHENSYMSSEKSKNIKIKMLQFHIAKIKLISFEKKRYQLYIEIVQYCLWYFFNVIINFSVKKTARQLYLFSVLFCKMYIFQTTLRIKTITPAIILEYTDKSVKQELVYEVLKHMINNGGAIEHSLTTIKLPLMETSDFCLVIKYNKRVYCFMTNDDTIDDLNLQVSFIKKYKKHKIDCIISCSKNERSLDEWWENFRKIHGIINFEHLFNKNKNKYCSGIILNKLTLNNENAKIKRDLRKILKLY